MGGCVPFVAFPWREELPSRRRHTVVAALGVSQTLSWSSSYYLPAILAGPISAGIGIPRNWLFAAFSASLLIAALAGPAVGRFIDRHGGRSVLMLSNVVLAAGLMALAASTGAVGLFLAWALIGIGIALGLYDAAFATLTALYGHEARGPITGITLIAGFASTISWPLSTFLNDTLGWRETCLVWAAINILVSLPINRWFLPPPVARNESPRVASHAIGWKPYKEMLLLVFVFSAASFVFGSMGAHLPTLLERAGATPLAAIAAAALVGPAQVAARAAELIFNRRFHPLASARLAILLYPLGGAALVVMGPAAAAAFAVLYGASNGLLTIARGTVPLAVFGPRAYGERIGLLAAPSRAAQASAPVVFGLMLDHIGLSIILVLAAFCVAAFGALLCLHAGDTDEAPI